MLLKIVNNLLQKSKYLSDFKYIEITNLYAIAVIIKHSPENVFAEDSWCMQTKSPCWFYFAFLYKKRSAHKKTLKEKLIKVQIKTLGVAEH